MNPFYQISGTLTPPPPDPSPAPPAPERIVTPELLFLNQGTTYRLGAAFAGTSNPTTVWQQMVDNSPQAMTYYRELEAKDDDIADAIAEVKLSVLSREMKVVPGDQSGPAVDAAAFVQSQLDRVTNWRNVLSALMDAPFYGYTLAEIMYDTSMGQAGLQDIVDVPQDLFCYGPFMYPQTGQLRLKTFTSALDGDLVDENKFLQFCSRPRHGNRMGSPILREIYWASWFKRNCQRFWLRLAERGPGTSVVKHKANATEDEKRKALQAAQALIEQVAVAVSEDFSVDVELLKGTRAADPQTYEQLYNVLESKIYRRIVGSTLTSHGSDGGKGTQALGKVHADTKDERSVELCLQLSDVVNRQLFRPLSLWNFGPNVPPPRLQFDIAEEADIRQDVDVANELSGMGLEIPVKYAYEHFGIPAPMNGEPTLKRQAPIVQPTLGAAGAETAEFAADVLRLARLRAEERRRVGFSASQKSRVDQDTADLDRVFGQLRTEMLGATREQLNTILDQVEQSYDLKR